MTTLVLTVGGSHQPLLRSIEQTKPDHVVFICSDDVSGGAKGSYVQVVGDGMVNKSSFTVPQPDLPNLVVLTKLNTDQYNLVKIPNCDNLDDCYRCASTAIAERRQQHPGETIIVDYTGGTKSMTAGLVLAALDDTRCIVQLVGGTRRDRDKVVGGTEYVQAAAVADVQASRLRRLAEQFLAHYNYAGAAELLEQALQQHRTDRNQPGLSNRLQFCRACDAWDAFDHERAQTLLSQVADEAFPPPMKPELDGLKRFLGMLLSPKRHGYERVQDLLRNAERRAAQCRYDDAVGRTYRALEMTAQTRLLQAYDLDTKKVSVDCLPNDLREQLRPTGPTVKLSLMHAWTWLSHQPNEPLGQLFEQERSHLLNALSTRNDSLLAHGVTPVSKADHARVSDVLVPFIDEAVRLAVQAHGGRQPDPAPQLPTRWDG